MRPASSQPNSVDVEPEVLIRRPSQHLGATAEGCDSELTSAGGRIASKAATLFLCLGMALARYVQRNGGGLGVRDGLYGRVMGGFVPSCEQDARQTVTRAEESHATATPPSRRPWTTGLASEPSR